MFFERVAWRRLAPGSRGVHAWVKYSHAARRTRRDATHGLEVSVSKTRGLLAPSCRAHVDALNRSAGTRRIVCRRVGSASTAIAYLYILIS